MQYLLKSHIHQVDIKNAKFKVLLVQASQRRVS